jgi:hypothetical protein
LTNDLKSVIIITDREGKPSKPERIGTMTKREMFEQILANYTMTAEETAFI